MRLSVFSLGLLLSVWSVHAEENPELWKSDHSLKPQVLHSDDYDKFSPAVKYSLGTRYDYAPDNGLKGFFSARSEGLLAWDKRAHSENLFAELVGGIVYNTYKRADSQRPVVVDPTLPPPLPKPGRDYGRFDFGLKARFETDQPFENYNFTYGPTIGYVHDNENGLWPLIPSLVLDYHRVEVLYSRQLNQLGVTDDSFFRLGVLASWKYRIGSAIAPDNKYLSPLGLHGDLRYYLAQDIPTAASNTAYKESFYVAGDVSYSLADLNVKWVREIFVRVAQGRIPPAEGNQTMVSLGVTLGWK